MKQSFPYIPPAAEQQLVYTDGETMAEAVEAFENQDYLKSLQLLVDALDCDFAERYGNADGTSFSIPHGSIVVHIRITADMLHITADFLKLPQKGKVAMLRRIAEMNINNLMLARFVKKGDFLQMEYSCPITDTHPHKIHAVIHNICAIGDRYDDELCTHFNAERCYTPRVTPYTPAKVDAVYNGLHTIGEQALKDAADYCSKRNYNYAWTLVAGAIQQFVFFANPQGQLINEIEKAVESMNDERPLEELVGRGTTFLRKLLDMSKPDLAKDLYSVEMIVSMKAHSPLQSMQEDFEPLHEGVTEAMQRKEYEQVVVRIYHAFYRLLAENDIPLLLEYLVVTALRESASLPIKDAAPILLTALDKIMDGDLEIPNSDDDDDDKEDAEEEELQEEAEEEEDEEALAQAHANVMAAHQKMVEAMSGDEIVAIQRQMDEALKAGDTTTYMRLATQLQMIMINALGK